MVRVIRADSKIRQFHTALKGVNREGCDTAPQNDVFQMQAPTECKRPDMGHAVGDGHARERVVAAKCIGGDPRNRISVQDGGQDDGTTGAGVVGDHCFAAGFGIGVISRIGRRPGGIVLQDREDTAGAHHAKPKLDAVSRNDNFICDLLDRPVSSQCAERGNFLETCTAFIFQRNDPPQGRHVLRAT